MGVNNVNSNLRTLTVTEKSDGREKGQKSPE